MKTNKLSPLSSALLLAITLPCHAQEASTTLDKVQVTGNRLPQATADSVHAVTVLTRADIEASQAVDVIDLLTRQTGIDIVRTGGSGAQNSLFMRGGNSNHTLILIDGIRVNSATQGLFDFAHLPLAMIERIEIVRGPRAAVWGSDALSGVVQIYTRTPESFNAELRAGSYGRTGADAGIGFGSAENRFGITAGFDSLNGFSATNADAWGYNPDKDGYNNRHLALQSRHEFGQYTFAFSGLATSGDIEFDQGRTLADNRSWSASLTGPIADDWNHSLVYGQTYEKLDTPAFEGVYGSQRRSLDWSNVVQSGQASQFGFGVNWAEESGYSNSYGSSEFKQDRRNIGAYGVFNSQWQNHRFELASRYDDNQQYGSNLTSSAGWSWQLSPESRLRATWGQGFRAPNFNELYYPGYFGFYAGNPNLDPERSNALEIGFETSLGAHARMVLSGYSSRVDDLISFSGPNGQAINISKADIRGAEAEFSGEHENWHWRANATWTQALNAETQQPLLRRPRLKANTDVSYRFANQSSIGAEFSAFSDRADVGGSLPGYSRLDLTASLPISDNWQVEARLENLFDRDYQLLDGFNTPGKSFLIRMRYPVK